MVSRRNYVTITLMILILMFMFMFTGVLKQELNEYNVNDYEETYISVYGFPSMFLTTTWKEGRGRDIKIFISKR